MYIFVNIIYIYIYNYTKSKEILYHTLNPNQVSKRRLSTSSNKYFLISRKHNTYLKNKGLQNEEVLV